MRRSGSWAPLATVAVLAAVALLAFASLGGDDGYEVRVALHDADGLREGSDVRMGGAAVGTVGELRLGDRDAVTAILHLDGGDASIGPDATAAIRSSNLLGSKFIELDPGKATERAPSGVEIPADRVTRPVDLDQVLDVLDGDTRERLGVLINEAGTAVTGRRADFNASLRELPPTLDAATDVLGALTKDARALEQLVVRSDRFVAQLVPQRRRIARLVGTAAATVRSTAARQRSIAQTLERAPGTLRSLRGFLDELRSTVVPLGPAARSIAASGPGLSATLRDVTPFTRSAQPALAAAERTAPRLTRLGTEATPVVSSARGTARSLATLVTRLAPVMKVLDVPGAGIDGALSAAEGWARATQVRDGISHMFRGHIIVSDTAVRSLVARLRPKETPARKQKAAPRKPSSPTAAETPGRPAETGPAEPGSAPKAPNPLDQVLPEVGALPQRLVDAVGGLLSPPKGAPRDADENALSALADFLLGP